MTRHFLDLRRLRYFVAIAKSGSLSQAARDLNIAQPALTHHLRELEREIGEKLFLRSARGVTLTALGETLNHHAWGILSHVDATEAEIRRTVRSLSRGRSLSIGLPPSLAGHLATRVIEMVERHLPGTVVRIEEVRSRSGEELIAAGRLDLVVTFVAPGAPLPGAALAWEQLCFVCAREGERSSTRPIELSAIAGIRLVLPSSGTLRELVEQSFARAGAQLEIAAEIDGIEARKQMVLSGRAATILPPYTVAGERRELLDVRPIIHPAIRRMAALLVSPDLDPALATLGEEVLLGLLKEWTD